MGRILAVDYGRKRVGIAVSDPLQIIAGGLTTVPTKDIFSFLKEYFSKEEVELIVVGYPVDLQNRAAEALEFVNPFLKRLQKEFPDLKIATFDERFTSKMAKATMLAGGLKKKARQNKELVDKISASLILQSFMDAQNIKK